MKLAPTAGFTKRRVGREEGACGPSRGNRRESRNIRQEICERSGDFKPRTFLVSCSYGYTDLFIRCAVCSVVPYLKTEVQILQTQNNQKVASRCPPVRSAEHFVVEYVSTCHHMC
jgi:hypothetical protein